jgi:hypothetical protein
MQVSVETLNDLERRVTVQVPAERLAKEIQERLAVPVPAGQGGWFPSGQGAAQS